MTENSYMSSSTFMSNVFMTSVLSQYFLNQTGENMKEPVVIEETLWEPPLRENIKNKRRIALHEEEV